MRLINTSSLKSQEFFGAKTPAYAILSHFWEDDEVTLQDLRDDKGSDKQGWGKVVGCCKKALEDGWEYVVSSLRDSYSSHTIMSKGFYQTPCSQKYLLIIRSGLILVASTRRAAPSSRSLSILCLIGTRTLTCVMLIFPTSQAATTTMNPEDLAFTSLSSEVGGSLEGGHSKNCLHLNG